jgi:hypothetical protein
MAISGKQLKSHFKDMGEMSGIKFRDKLVETLGERKEYGLKIKGKSQRDRHGQLKGILEAQGVDKKIIKKIYSVNKNEVERGDKMAAGVFKELLKGSTKKYQEKRDLELVKSFREKNLESESEPKFEEQSKSGRLRDLFRGKDKEEKEGNKFAEMKQQQIGTAVNNNGSTKIEEVDNNENINLRRTNIPSKVSIEPGKQKTTNPDSEFPFPRVGKRREDEEDN